MAFIEGCDAKGKETIKSFRKCTLKKDLVKLAYLGYTLKIHISQNMLCGSICQLVQNGEKVKS